MSQALVVNEQVINAIDVLTISGHLTQQEQIYLYKKMLMSQTSPANIVPSSDPTPTVAAPATATITVTPATEEHGKVKRVRNHNPRFTRTHPSEEEIVNAVARLKLGVDALEVARDMGVSGTYVKKLCGEHNLVYVTRYGKRHRYTTEAEQSQIKAMIDAGHTCTEVQIAMDLSSGTVTRYGYPK